MQATANYGNDGDAVANHRIPGDQSIPRMIANRMRRHFNNVEYNIGLMPSSPPSLEWDKGHIETKFSRHNIAIDWNGENLADVTVDTGYPVQVSLSRQPHFRITGIEPAVQNRTLGRYIDRTV